MTVTRFQRFTVLDVFRGMTVFLMIVVNTQGSGARPFAQMEHAEWHGFTLTDLVFPSFLFAVGNAMVFSMRKFSTQSHTTVVYKIFKRTALIFLVGYLLSWYPFIAWNDGGSIWLKPLSETRILAVLQRIAVAYCFVALLIHYLSNMRALIIVAISILLVYWGLLYWLGDAGLQYTIEGNAVRKLDILLLGEKHMYREKGIVFDPEGVLSTFPAIVNVVAGYWAGDLLVRKGIDMARVQQLLIWGLVLVVLAIAWNTVLPVNKKLWTSSFVLLTVGIDLAALACLFYLLELKGWKPGVYFFTVFGKNPLFIYLLSSMLGITFLIKISGDEILVDWVNRTVFQVVAPGAWGCFLFSLCYALLCWVVGWWLDKRKIYIRL